MHSSMQDQLHEFRLPLVPSSLLTAFRALQYRVMIVIFTFCVTIVSTLYNILGTNLYVQATWKNIYDVFLETVISSISVGIIIALVIVWYCRKERILCY